MFSMCKCGIVHLVAIIWEIGSPAPRKRHCSDRQNVCSSVFRLIIGFMRENVCFAQIFEIRVSVELRFCKLLVAVRERN